MAAYWAPLIRKDLTSSVEAILRTGQRFLAAKVACEHGEFGKLFDKDRNAVAARGVAADAAGELRVGIAYRFVPSSSPTSQMLERVQAGCVPPLRRPKAEHLATG